MYIYKVEILDAFPFSAYRALEPIPYFLKNKEGGGRGVICKTRCFEGKR